MPPPGDEHADASHRGVGGYWNLSKSPLQILVFLLPLVLGYEISLMTVLRRDEINISAHEGLRRAFEVFGIGDDGLLIGLHLPAILLVVVLLVWHMLSRKPWTVSGSGLALMMVEAVLLTVPLIVVSQVISRAGGIHDATGVLTAAPRGVGDLGVISRLAVSVGAGLYEELVFRMLIIAVVHTIVVDVLKQSVPLGACLGIAVSAILFTLYHPGYNETSARAVFLLFAGVYFGVIFILRGFGIVVAAHTLYDVAAVLNLPQTDAL